MMDKDEAVRELSKVARISVAYAEDLYDSFFEKPVVPQFVADWYEEVKDSFNFYLVEVINNIPHGADEEDFSNFEKWIDDEDDSLTILVNMHQFGYEIEKEKRYTVRVNTILGQYLERYYLDNEILTPQFKRTQYAEDEAPSFTRKELEDANFGWVFNCEGIEIEEVE